LGPDRSIFFATPPYPFIYAGLAADDQTSLHSSTSSIMPPQIPREESGTQVKAELEGLLANGWELEEEILLKKTYFCKTYTKVVVGKTTRLLWQS
jgi:hypothetical protein